MAAAIPEAGPHGEHYSSDTIHNASIENSEKFVPTRDATDEESGTPLEAPAPELQRWNQSKVNIFRYCSTMYSFILMGMMDGAMGVCLLPS